MWSLQESSLGFWPLFTDVPHLNGSGLHLRSVTHNILLSPQMYHTQWKSSLSMLPLSDLLLMSSGTFSQCLSLVLTMPVPVAVGCFDRELSWVSSL